MPSPPEPSLAARMGDIQPFRVMELLARARQLEADGKDIVHMEIGEPDFATPSPILDAATKAIARGDMHYTPATGLPALRQAIATHYLEQFGVTVSAGQIVITPGASGALLLVLGILLDPGQSVLMADPGYPCNRNFVRLLEGHSQAVPVSADSGYQLTPELVARHWSETTRAVLVASPSNPTGTLIDGEQLAAIAAVAQQHGGQLIVDEIYQELVYETRPQSVLQTCPEVFVINSFSKYYGMTGWRVGWVVAPPWAVNALDKLAQNVFLAAPTPSQHAAVAAFSAPARTILAQRREAFKTRRDYLYPALQSLGFGIALKPQGAFYLYANCEAFSADSHAFARTLLEEIGVAVTPGLGFGHHQPEKHLRFAYTTSLERLQEGVRRLSVFLKN